MQPVLLLLILITAQIDKLILPGVASNPFNAETEVKDLIYRFFYSRLLPNYILAPALVN